MLSIFQEKSEQQSFCANHYTILEVEMSVNRNVKGKPGKVKVAK
jgi:hypothetical protein